MLPAALVESLRTGLTGVCLSSEQDTGSVYFAFQHCFSESRLKFCSWRTVKNICLFPATWETEETHFGNRHWGRGLQVKLVTVEHLTLIYYCPDITVIGINWHLNLQTPKWATASRLLWLALFLAAYTVLMIDLPGVALLQAPREGRGRGSWRHIFPRVISSHLFWTVKWVLVVKSCRSIPFKCQTSTASAAHKEIFEGPWREAKRTNVSPNLTPSLAGCAPAALPVWREPPSSGRQLLLDCLHCLPCWQQDKGNKEAAA